MGCLTLPWFLFKHVVWLVGDYLDEARLLPKPIKRLHTQLGFHLDLEDPYDSY